MDQTLQQPFNTYVCVYVCMYVCMYAYIYVYISFYLVCRSEINSHFSFSCLKEFRVLDSRRCTLLHCSVLGWEHIESRGWRSWSGRPALWSAWSWTLWWQWQRGEPSTICGASWTMPTTLCTLSSAARGASSATGCSFQRAGQTDWRTPLSPVPSNCSTLH